MTGGPELRPGRPEGAVPGRPHGGRPARAGETPSTPFDALLSGMTPKGDAEAAAAGDARPLARLVDLTGATPGRVAGRAEGAEAGPETAALDSAAQGQTLAEGVAERIAAALPGVQAADAEATNAGEAGPGRADARRGAALGARVAVAASLARLADQAGAAPGRDPSQAISLVRRETVFAATTTSRAGPQPVSGGAHSSPAGLAAGLPSTEGSRAASEPGPVRQGRAEQLMLGERPPAMRGAAVPAKAPEAVAVTLARAGEAKAATAPASGDAAGVAANEGAALGMPGAADQRTSGTGAPAAAPAAQPTAAPATFSMAPGAVKVLHIQLHPVELGTLEVRMRMTDGGLEVHIEASRPETVALLKSDRDTLESVLRGAGQTLDAVTVSLADKSGGASGQASQDGGQGPASGARGEAQAGSPQEQGGRFDDRSPSRPNGPANEKVHDDQNQPAPSVRPRGALYL